VASSPSKGPSNSNSASKAARKQAVKSKQGGAPAPAPSKASKVAKGPKPANVATQSATAGMNGTQKISWYGLQLLIFLVPIAISNFNWLTKLGFTGAAIPLTYDQFDIVKVFIMRAFAIVALGAWAFDFFLRGGKIRRTKLDWLIVGFLGWVLLTSFTSISIATALFGKYRRFEGFFSFLTYAVIFFLVVQFADRPSRIRSLAQVFMLSSFIVAGYGVLQRFGLDPINWGSNLPFEANRAFSTFGNPDLLGGFLIFPLAISLSMALSEKRSGWRIFYWVTFLITVAAWIFAFVRGAWIGGAVALLVLLVAAILARPKLGAIDWSFLGLSAVGGFAYAIYNTLTSTNAVMNVGQRLASILQTGEGSALTRFEIWQAAWAGISSSPLRAIFGFGADTFRLVFPKFKPLAYVKDAGYLSVADNVHNYPLQLMAGIGIIGFLLLYGIFGWALWLAAPNAFARGKGTDRLVIAGFWAAAVGYIANLMTGLSVTGSTVFLWIALAIILAPIATEHEHRAPSWGPIASMGFIAVLTVAFIGNGVFIVADNYFLRSQFPSTGEDGIALGQTAIALDPYNDQYRSMLGKAYESQMLGWLNQASTDQAAKKDTTVDIQQATAAFTNSQQTLKDTIAMVPTEYDNYLFIASLYNEAGTYLDPKYLPDAITWADKGIEVEPYGPGVRLQKAVAQSASGDINGALATIATAVSWDPNYADIHLFYAQTLTRVGRNADAATVYKQVIALDPTNTGYVSAYAQVLTTLGKLPEAAAQYKKLLELDPTNTTYSGQLKSIENSIGPSAATIPTPTTTSTP
jgi:O-antigen ligase